MRRVRTSRDLATRYGYGEEAATIQKLYLSGQKREAEAAVPLELIRSISLVGSKSFVADRVASLKQAGVTTLAVHALASSHEARLHDIEMLADIAG